MLTLKLFATASVAAEGRPVTGRAAQGRRLALLTVLALARGRAVTRDKLTALLWPESSTERARHRLSDTLYIVRTALGEDVVRSTSDELLLAPEGIEIDVETFERLLDDGRLEPAVELVAGPLLDGFHLAEAAEFEHWLDRERARVGRRYAGALESLAESSEQYDRFDTAAGWWRRLAAHDPYNGRVALRLMRSLEASGDRAGALQHARVHTVLLRDEFDAAPDPEVVVFAERLRLEPPARSAPEPAGIQPVGGGAEALTRQDVEPAITARVGSRPAQPIHRRKRSLAAAALLAVSFLVGTAWTVWVRDEEPERSIVVLPFIDLSPDQQNDHFSDGLTEEVISRLAAVPELKVISRTSAMHYKGSKASLRQIADELDVAHVLEGSVRQSDGRMRISAQLIDARGDEHLWAANYEYELQDVFRVQEKIAGQVVQALEVKLGEQGRRMLAKHATRDPEAYQLYRRGQFLWRSRFYEGHRQAIEYYRKAIERDSGYTDAYAGLAEIQFVAELLHFSSDPEAEAYSRLKWAAERALALDDESADAHAAFASALWWNRNWPGAARELRRALELNPSHPMARSWLSLLLGGMGRAEEALQESRRAATLDPFSIVVSCNYGWQCYMSREYDCAIRQYRHALEIAPKYGTAWRGLGLTYAQRGMFPEAIDALRKAADRAPGYLGDLAYAQALTGETESARATLSRAKAEPQNGFSIARAYVALDKPDSAFAWLERSSWRWPHEANRADPALDPLRSDPRFAKLVVRVDREMGVQ